LWQFKRKFVEQCDSEPLHVRGVDPGNEVFGVRIVTPELKFGKGKEKNMCWRAWVAAWAFLAQMESGIRK
jgi:hypothetical protein